MNSVHNPHYWGFFTTDSLLKSISWHNIPPRSPRLREEKGQLVALFLLLLSDKSFPVGEDPL